MSFKVNIKKKGLKMLFLGLFFLIFVGSVEANIGTAGFGPYLSDYFVETGTYGGSGILKALQAGFKHIISMDIESAFVRDAKIKFQAHENVTIIEGSSQYVLWDAIKNIDTRITFWLDAHVFPGIEGKQNTPLMEELEQIRWHSIKDHIILIDDMSCCGSLAFDYIDRSAIENKIWEINPNYTIEYIVGGDADEAVGNILVAYVN
jgi:hypothetical protein